MLSILVSIFWLGLEEKELLQSCNCPSVGGYLACGMVKLASILLFKNLCSCHGLTPAGSSASCSHPLLQPWWDGIANWKRKSDKVAKLPCDCEVSTEILSFNVFQSSQSTAEGKNLFWIPRKTPNKPDQVQWRAAKVVSELKHCSVRSQECWAGAAWRRLQGAWAAFLTWGLIGMGIQARQVMRGRRTRSSDRLDQETFWVTVGNLSTMRSQVLDQVTSRDVVHLHPWRFSRPNYFKTMRNLVWSHTWPVLEQEVGLETTQGSFLPQLSCDPKIWFVEV